MYRSDGLDNPMSPNGPHPLYYVEEPDGRRHGPYGCRAEAVNASEDEMAEISDHAGRQPGVAGDPY